MFSETLENSEAVSPRCSVKKVFFTGKYLCRSLFFNKVAGLRPETLLKKRLWHRCFPMNFAKVLGTAFFTEHLRWLLPKTPTQAPKKLLQNGFC